MLPDDSGRNRNFSLRWKQKKFFSPATKTRECHWAYELSLISVNAVAAVGEKACKLRDFTPNENATRATTNTTTCAPSEKTHNTTTRRPKPTTSQPPKASAFSSVLLARCCVCTWEVDFLTNSRWIFCYFEATFLCTLEMRRTRNIWRQASIDHF